MGILSEVNDREAERYVWRCIGTKLELEMTTDSGFITANLLQSDRARVLVAMRRALIHLFAKSRGEA